jgi:hypothetical protein
MDELKKKVDYLYDNIGILQRQITQNLQFIDIQRDYNTIVDRIVTKLKYSNSKEIIEAHKSIRAKTDKMLESNFEMMKFVREHNKQYQSIPMRTTGNTYLPPVKLTPIEEVIEGFGSSSPSRKSLSEGGRSRKKHKKTKKQTRRK